MKRFENISDWQFFFFGDTEKDHLVTFQNTDYQHLYCCIFSSTFTGKEKDPETGYSYFGARYLEHELTTAWLSVDPMADKYPSISPYAYCAWNPVKLVDPIGMDTIVSINIDNGEVGMQGFDKHIKGSVVCFFSDNGNTKVDEYVCSGNISYKKSPNNTVVEFDNSDDAEGVYNKLSGKENINTASSVEWNFYKNKKKYTSILVTSHKIDEVDVTSFQNVGSTTIEFRHYHPYNTSIIYCIPSKNDFEYSKKLGVPCFLDYCGKSYRFDNIRIYGNYSPNRIKDIIKEKYGIEYLFCK